MRVYLLCGQSDVRIQTSRRDRKKLFFCSAEDGGRLRGRRFETGSKSSRRRRRWQCFCSFLYYQTTTTTTIITFSCVFFTLGRRKWLHSSHQELRLRRRPPFSTFYSSAVLCFWKKMASSPHFLLGKLLSHTTSIATNSRDCLGKKIDFRHEVSMRKFSYLLQYDKILYCWSL